MSDYLNNKLTEYLTEYGNKTGVKNFSNPKIYHGGDSFDLSKRWYVYFSFRNPHSGKMERQPPIYYNVNRDFKTKSSRLKHLKLIAAGLKELLNEGYNPYKDRLSHSCIESLDFAMSIRARSIEATTLRDYTNRYGHFRNYLINNGFERRPITTINREIVNDFLNSILMNSSARNRNNYKTVLSSLFSVLVSNGRIENNFILTMDKLKSTPTMNRVYTDSNVDKLFKYLDTNEPVLFLFIKVFSYCFLRPIEVCRLRVSDVDLAERRLVFKAKNKPVKYKLIPEIIVSDLSKLDLSTPDHYLFTPDGPGNWSTSETSRREYFTDLFKSVKNRFNFGSEYTMYSFRHYFITKLYRHFRKSYSKTETLERLQLVTGHESISGLKNYLRTIDAELPKDWSDGLKI